jgi:transposase
MASIGRDGDRGVVIGVDPHPGSHMACAMDATGRVLGEREVSNDPEGLERLHAWGKGYGKCRWAVEGPASAYARGMVAKLRDAGEEVVGIAPAMTAQYRGKRWRGKSDKIDAANAARALLANPGLPQYEPPPYQERLKELTRSYQRVSQQLRATRMAARTLQTGEAQVALAQVIVALEQAAHDLKETIRATVVPLAAPLLARQGVGPIVAGVVLAEAGRVGRFSSRDHFAAFAGCAPIPWASGAGHAVRVNPGGNRRLNWAAHIVVLGRLRLDPQTRAYRDRKLSQGKTQREVIRSLKTYVCRELYACLRTINSAPMPS